MENNLEKGVKIRFEGKLYQVVVNKDKMVGFLKIDGDNYIIPSALEFLKLNSLINPNSIYKFI